MESGNAFNYENTFYTHCYGSFQLKTLKANCMPIRQLYAMWQ